MLASAPPNKFQERNAHGDRSVVRSPRRNKFRSCVKCRLVRRASPALTCFNLPFAIPPLSVDLDGVCFYRLASRSAQGSPVIDDRSHWLSLASRRRPPQHWSRIRDVRMSSVACCFFERELLRHSDFNEMLGHASLHDARHVIGRQAIGLKAVAFPD